MEPQNTESEDKNQKQIYKEKSSTFFIISIIFFIFFICDICISKVEDLPAAVTGIIVFILSLVMLGISASFFFKYKLQKKIIAHRNISTMAAIGTIMIMLIFSWRLIITASRNLITGLRMSVIEWVIIGVGITLIALGIFRKSKSNRH